MNAAAFQTGDAMNPAPQSIGVRKKRWMVCFENTILDLDLPIYEKMVYIVLCSHAKKDGSAFPSVNTIAREASCSRAKVFEALKTLEERGVIARDRRIYEGRGQTSNQYEILDILPRPQSGPGESTSKTPGSTTWIGESTVEMGESATWMGGATTQMGGVHHVDAVEQDISNKTKEQKEQEQKTPPTPQAQTQQLSPQGSEKLGEGKLGEEIRKAYNAILPELPQAEILTASRAKTLNQRIGEDPARAEAGWWRQYFGQVREFPWPMGQNAGNWRADFDWLIGEKGMQKILEGGFTRSAAVSAAGGRTEAGVALQRKYTDENGVVDARALLRELYGA
jgi:biotin operon repressor